MYGQIFNYLNKNRRLTISRASITKAKIEKENKVIVIDTVKYIHM